MQKEAGKKSGQKGEGTVSRAFFREAVGLFNSVSDGVVVYERTSDGKDFIIRDLNRSAERIDKIKRADVIGRSVTEIFPGIREMGLLSVFERVWITGKAEKHPAVVYKDERISGWRENNVFKSPTGEIVATYRDLTEEKKAEEDLRRSEDQYRKMFDSMTDIVFLLGSDLKIKMINPAGTKMAEKVGLGKTMVGKTIFEAMPFLPKAAKKEYEEVLKTGKPFSGEVKYYTGNKMLIGQTKRIPVVQNGKIVGILGMIHDITALKEGELALKKNIERFNYIASLAGEVIWESDMDGIATYLSPASEKILGFKPGEIIGKKRYADLLIPEDRERLGNLIKRCYEKRDEFHRVVVIAERKNKERVTLELSGTPVFGEEGEAVGYIGIASDITDRQAYEENLRKFQLAVENASDHIIITDRDGNILFANKAASTITGYPIKEMIGKRPSLWGKQMPPEFYKDMWHRIKELKETFVGEVTNRRKNGELYVAEARISPIVDASGSVIFFIGIERDITKAKEVDRAKTEFVSLASHQLRTPLSIINWYTEMLLGGDKGELDEGQREYVREIHNSGHRMIDLVNALLNASRIDMGTLAISPKPTDFGAVADVVISELLPQIEKKKLSVTKDYDAVPKIDADPDLVRVIFQNLISNAVKYTPDKGKISVIVELRDEEVVIKVEDNGYGIPEGQQSKIFTKLFRADNAREVDPDGTGLGLYIVKAIADASGGRAWFKSKEGKGSTFYVALPAIGMKTKKGSKGLV
jgi:PAS domain S-box-containing protein